MVTAKGDLACVAKNAKGTCLNGIFGQAGDKKVLAMAGPGIKLESVTSSMDCFQAWLA